VRTDEIFALAEEVLRTTPWHSPVFSGASRRARKGGLVRRRADGLSLPEPFYEVAYRAEGFPGEPPERREWHFLRWGRDGKVRFYRARAEGDFLKELEEAGLWDLPANGRLAAIGLLFILTGVSGRKALRSQSRGSP
jgi:hypothetical protein